MEVDVGFVQGALRAYVEEKCLRGRHMQSRSTFKTPSPSLVGTLFEANGQFISRACFGRCPRPAALEAAVAVEVRGGDPSRPRDLPDGVAQGVGTTYTLAPYKIKRPA